LNKLNSIVYLQVYRRNDAPIESVEKEVSHFLRFIYTRSKLNKDIVYIVVSYSVKGRYSGYIILVPDEKCRDQRVLDKEADIIRSYVLTNFKDIYVDIEKPKKPKYYIPLPPTSFFR